MDISYLRLFRNQKVATVLMDLYVLVASGKAFVVDKNKSTSISPDARTLVEELKQHCNLGELDAQPSSVVDIMTRAESWLWDQEIINVA